MSSKKAVHIINHAKFNAHTAHLGKNDKALTFNDTYKTKVCQPMFRLCHHNVSIPLLSVLQTNQNVHRHITRYRENFIISPYRNCITQQNFLGIALKYSINCPIIYKKISIRILLGSETIVCIHILRRLSGVKTVLKKS